MARRRKKTSKIPTGKRRGVITKTQSLTARLPRRKLHLKPRLLTVDNRHYSPLSRVRDLSGLSLQIFPTAIPSNTSTRMDRSGKLRRLGGEFSSRAFIPHRTEICVRRKIRREVIMAATGGGSISKHKPRQNPNSQLICRRN